MDQTDVMDRLRVAISVAKANNAERGFLTLSDLEFLLSRVQRLQLYEADGSGASDPEVQRGY
jgi:hypothetical protein